MQANIIPIPAKQPKRMAYLMALSFTEGKLLA